MNAHTAAARVVLLGLLIAFVPRLQAENYPNRPISIVVPLAVGDSGDIAARAMAEHRRATRR